MPPSSKSISETHLFTGNVYFFHGYDIGEDINFERLKASDAVSIASRQSSKYFKYYHAPLSIEARKHGLSPFCIEAKIHAFGAISLTYKIPFSKALESVRKDLDALDDQYEIISLKDAEKIYSIIKPFVTKPKFNQMNASHVVIQVDPQPEAIDTVAFKENFGSMIASTLRFETETLSEYQKNEILESAIGYFRGDLLVIDTEASFVYDDEFPDIQEFFEFANLQQLELRYFDRLLDQHLNMIYEDKQRSVPITSYLPFVGVYSKNQVDELGKLKVDISVITERLEGSIKLAGEPYYSELYALLQDKLDLKGWQEAVDKKLSITLDIRSVLQNKIDSVREDLLTVLIVILIFIELVVGLLSYARH